MNKKKILAFILAGALTATAVTVPIAIYASEQAKQAYQPTITSKENKKMVYLLEGDILEFATDYEVGCSAYYLPEDYNTDNYGPNKKYREDAFAPAPFTLTWEGEEKASCYTLKIATKPDFSDEVEYVTFTNEHTFEDLFMGTKYYYQIVAQYEKKTVNSPVFSFQTAYMPRTIFVDKNLSNTRDCGGYYTEDGKHRIRQGLIYRGAKLENITQEGKDKLLNVYGIKTDLDMRAEATVSPLGDGVKFVNVSGPYYVGSTGVNSTADSSKGPWKGTYREALLEEIKTFAEPKNYPIYIHCSLGRDRTGTLAFLINALCGVGLEDLYRDYETSFFSTMGCYDGQSPAVMMNNIKNLYTFLNNYAEGDTLAEKTEKFMLDIGVTQAEIDSIRSILLEEV